MNKTRTIIRNIVERIEPFDEGERDVVERVLGWIDEGRELYRTASPDVPPEHLVSYFVLVDHPRRSVLLVDHIKAGLWLPTGGHVEPGEDPRGTVLREIAEELGSRAATVASVAMMPLFITAGKTRGQGAHTDISLWYVVAADENMWLDPDPREFRGHRWQTLDSVLDTDIDELDPHMHRFVRKLQSRM
jgi:8-oxo-dGTP pyrophosphatase MutT (NUDIX family)